MSTQRFQGYEREVYGKLKIDFAYQNDEKVTKKPLSLGDFSERIYLKLEARNFGVAKEEISTAPSPGPCDSCMEPERGCSGPPLGLNHGISNSTVYSNHQIAAFWRVAMGVKLCIQHSSTP